MKRRGRPQPGPGAPSRSQSEREPDAYEVLLVQLTSLLSTGPFEVGELNVQLTVSVPKLGCETVTVALVNATSVMSSIQFGFGHSGAPATGVSGPAVTSTWLIPNVVLPFL